MSGGICHWGPLLALSIIITLFLCGLYCTLLWFPPWTSIASAIHLAFFLSWMFLIMNYFLKSIYLGPGYLPLGWRAVSLDLKQHGQCFNSTVKPYYGSGSQLLTGSQQLQKLQYLYANFMANTKFS